MTSPATFKNFSGYYYIQVPDEVKYALKPEESGALKRLAQQIGEWQRDTINNPHMTPHQVYVYLTPIAQVMADTASFKTIGNIHSLSACVFACPEVREFQLAVIEASYQENQCYVVENPEDNEQCRPREL